MSGMGGRPGTMSGFRSRESPGLGPEPGLKATDSRERDKNEREIPRDGKSRHFGNNPTRRDSRSVPALFVSRTQEGQEGRSGQKNARLSRPVPSLAHSYFTSQIK